MALSALQPIPRFEDPARNDGAPQPRGRSTRRRSGMAARSNRWVRFVHSVWHAIIAMPSPRVVSN